MRDGLNIHDAITQKDELITLFNLGYLSLDDRAKGEILFWEVCRKLSRIFSYKSLKYIPEEFEEYVLLLADGSESVGKLLKELREPRPFSGCARFGHTSPGQAPEYC